MSTDILVGKKLRNFAMVNWFLLVAFIVDLNFHLLKYAGQTVDNLIGRPVVLVVACIVGYVYLLMRFWFEYQNDRGENLFNNHKSKYSITLSNIIKKYMNKRKEIYNYIEITSQGRHIDFKYDRQKIGERKNFLSQGSSQIVPNHLRYFLWYHISMFKSSKNNIIGDYLTTFMLFYVNTILYVWWFASYLICLFL
ncbi:MAG: hypothetical protein ABUK01_13855 [Leptospirales bacterium]